MEHLTHEELKTIEAHADFMDSEFEHWDIPGFAVSDMRALLAEVRRLQEEPS